MTFKVFMQCVSTFELFELVSSSVRGSIIFYYILYIILIETKANRNINIISHLTIYMHCMSTYFVRNSYIVKKEIITDITIH